MKSSYFSFFFPGNSINRMYINTLMESHVWSEHHLMTSATLIRSAPWILYEMSILSSAVNILQEKQNYAKTILYPNHMKILPRFPHRNEASRTTNLWSDAIRVLTHPSFSCLKSFSTVTESWNWNRWAPLNLLVDMLGSLCLQVMTVLYWLEENSIPRQSHAAEETLVTLWCFQQSFGDQIGKMRLFISASNSVTFCLLLPECLLPAWDFGCERVAFCSNTGISNPVLYKTGNVRNPDFLTSQMYFGVTFFFVVLLLPED